MPADNRAVHAAAVRDRAVARTTDDWFADQLDAATR
jgi:hypothetical protein